MLMSYLNNAHYFLERLINEIAAERLRGFLSVQFYCKLVEELCLVTSGPIHNLNQTIFF